MNNNVVPSNFDVYPENLELDNAVSMNNISWDEPKQDSSVFMLSNNQLVDVLSNAANNTTNAEGLKMFQGCLEDPIAGDSMCFIPKPEPVNYKFQNRHSWANVSGDQVVISEYNKDNEIISINCSRVIIYMFVNKSLKTIFKLLSLSPVDTL